MDDENSFVLPVYRRKKYPWDSEKKPVLLLHFTVIPASPSDEKAAQKEKNDA